MHLNCVLFIPAGYKARFQNPFLVIKYTVYSGNMSGHLFYIHDMHVAITHYLSQFLDGAKIRHYD